MRRISIIIITTILFFNCKGQDSINNAYSLKEAQTYAIKNNYQVQMASIEIGISQKTVSSLIALGMPQVEGSGSFQHFIDIPTSVVPADAFGFPNWFNQWINDVSQSTTIYPNAPATWKGLEPLSNPWQKHNLKYFQFVPEPFWLFQSCYSK